MSNNIEGVYKRGIVLGFVIGRGNINCIVSSNVYFQVPRLKVGRGVAMGYTLVCYVGGSTLMHFSPKGENTAGMAGKCDYLTDGLPEKEAVTLGDKRPDFTHTE
jgi:hypothetical protein